jgi:hypothetical protein
VVLRLKKTDIFKSVVLNYVGAKAKTSPFARCLRQPRCTNGDKTTDRLYPSSHASLDEGL